MRHLAWLHASPKPPPGSKRAAAAGASPAISRIERLKRDKLAILMPPNPAPHLTEWLTEIGLVSATGMSSSPLSWVEIGEWQRQVNIALAPWEARLIRQLSAAYVAEGRLAESETCPPPWKRPVTQAEIDAAERRLRMVLG